MWRGVHPYGDVALEYIVYEYLRGSQAESYRSGATPEDILRIFAHEHDPGAIVEKGSGLPFLSKALSGFNLDGAIGEALERSEDGA